MSEYNSNLEGSSEAVFKVPTIPLRYRKCNYGSTQRRYNNGVDFENTDSAINNFKNVAEKLETLKKMYNSMNDMLHSPSSSSQSLYSKSKRGVSSAVTTYLPYQRTKWRRNRPYTRLSLVQAVRAATNGSMSTVQAARRFGVSLTLLYNEVEKVKFSNSINEIDNSTMYDLSEKDELGQKTKTDFGVLERALELGCLEQEKLEIGCFEQGKSDTGTVFSANSLSRFLRYNPDDGRRVKMGFNSGTL